MGKIGLIFDMDGVIVDNAWYHALAWIKFAEKYGIVLSEEEVKSRFGSINEDILRALFKRDIMPVEIERMAIEKEEIYRNVYRENVEEVAGLTNFLKGLDMNNFVIGVATSAPPKNVEFILGATYLNRFFDIVTDESEIKYGKPHPEIFLKTAEKMGINPEDCIVFEDSFHGIEAGNRAGMKVIGLGTTHPKESLNSTILNIDDFSSLDNEMIINLSWNKT